MSVLKAKNQVAWAPFIATNDDVCDFDVRGSGNWQKYHAILKDGREIELRRVTGILDKMTESKTLMFWAASQTASYISSQLMYLMPEEVLAGAGLTPSKEMVEMAKDLQVILKIRDKDGFLSLDDQIAFAKKLSRLCDNARLEYNKVRDTAAEWGKQAHSWIERFLRHNYWPDQQELDEMPEPVFNSLRLFAETWESEKLQVVKGGVEMRVYDVSLGVAGTVDLLALDENGQLWVVDWKTAKGIYKTNVLQMAAYAGCLTVMGHKIAGAILVNNGREHGITQIRRLTIEELAPFWLYFRDLCWHYQTNSDIDKMCAKWNEDHAAVNAARIAAVAAAASGNAAGHLDAQSFKKELLKAVKKSDVKLHAILKNLAIGEMKANGFEIIIPPDFGWHREQLLEGLPLIEEIAEKLSGIAGYEAFIEEDLSRE